MTSLGPVICAVDDSDGARAALKVALDLGKLAFVRFKLIDELWLDMFMQQILHFVSHDLINQIRYILFNYATDNEVNSC